MDSNNGSNTKRIELSGGHWAKIRVEPAITAADLREQQLTRIRDGRDGYDPLLDTMATFKTRITEWSRGPVDAENIGNLPGPDTMTLVHALLGINEEAEAALPPLETSSDGNEVKKVRRSRGSGESGG